MDSTSEGDQLETLVQAKDDLLQQVDTYSGQVKEFNKENFVMKRAVERAFCCPGAG